MNWDALGALGELVGSLAVLLTLVYLSLQVRSAREELKHSIRQSNSTANMEIVLETVRNPMLARALSKTVTDNPIAKALQDVYVLDVEESIVLTNYYAARLRLARETIIYDLEFLDETAKAHFDRSTARIFGSGPGNMFWKKVLEQTPDYESEPSMSYIKDLLDDT